MTAESPYLFNLKAVARRLLGGAGNISGSQMALPPAPVLRADSQSSIPGLSQGEPSLLHSALLLPSILHSLSGDVLLPSFHRHETFPFEGGSQGGKGAAAGRMGYSGAPAPCPPLTTPNPRQQPPSRGNRTQSRLGIRRTERKYNTPKSYSSLACMTPGFSSPSIFDSFYPSPF